MENNYPNEGNDNSFVMQSEAEQNSAASNNDQQQDLPAGDEAAVVPTAVMDAEITTADHNDANTDDADAVLTAEFIEQEAVNEEVISHSEEALHSDDCKQAESTPNFILYEESNQQQGHTQSHKGSRLPHKGYDRKIVVLALSCLLMGGIGGVGGSMIANHLSSNKRTTVIYQGVEQVDKNGNAVTNMSIKDIVANTEQSVVEITTESAATDSFFEQMVTTGAGSGVIISKDGYIVTNNHVVEGANKITVRDKNGTEYDAKLIGTDAKTDLAVIKIEASKLSAAVLGTSSSLSVGDEAIAIGNPLGELGGTVTRGIISALDREITIDGQTMTLLQTDTAINKGNSGGGLFNDEGHLIGIVNAKSSGTSVEGLGFAIPIDTAKPVIESLIANGYVTGRPQLGVTMVNITDEMTAFQSGVNELGVYIAKVHEDSAAEEAGLEVKDRIISVDGKEISASDEIAKIIESKKVNDAIKIVVERDGKKVSVTATLKEAVNDAETSLSNNR